MKKQILLIGIVLISIMTFGQKKEVKKAEKAIKSGNFTEAITLLKQAEGLITNADSNLKGQYYLAKGEAYLGSAGNDFSKMKIASEAFAKALEISPNSKNAANAENGIQNIKVALVNSAIDDQKAKKFALASEKLFESYMISKKDTSYLYFAAGNAVNAKDYNKALDYYKQLLDLGYTGKVKEFIATDIETGEIVVFAGENDRNTNMLTGKYTTPSERMASSNRGNILRNVTLIYISQGENEKAMEVMKSAREENPNDASLMRAEADMAYKAGNLELYNELMEDIIETDPNNPELYYNLGVGSSKNGDNEKAMNYYKKALELNPDYAEAQINIASILLSKEGSIIEEMNALGTSSADYDRYDELKEVKDNLYKDALPFLESASKLRKDNVELVRTLMNIYSQLGEDDKFKIMKSRLEQMGGN